jgi:hypothetical protein
MSSNTGEEQGKTTKPGTFKKGDPRINRKGRPKSFDAWRALTIEVLQEPAKDAHGQPIVIDGHIATNAEMLARTWLKDPKRQQALVEAAFGKVPQQIDLNVDFTNLSSEQLERIAKGEDVYRVISDKGTG